jgi:hypothetical protein
MAADAVMKPRRENGATFVSPMTSDVSRGSALMMDFPPVCWNVHSTKQLLRKANHQPARIRLISVADASGASGKSGTKKQGRRRSITPSGLASPDIEIGLRRPVNYSLTRNFTEKCDPFHNRHKKCSAGSFGEG